MHRYKGPVVEMGLASSRKRNVLREQQQARGEGRRAALKSCRSRKSEFYLFVLRCWGSNPGPSIGEGD
jgi:hypothetical protein